MSAYIAETQLSHVMDEANNKLFEMLETHVAIDVHRSSTNMPQCLSLVFVLRLLSSFVPFFLFLHVLIHSSIKSESKLLES